MSELRTATLSNLAGTGPATLTGQSAAKAWGYTIYAAGAPANTASFNVSSITDFGLGTPDFNLTNAFSSTAFAVVIGSQFTAIGTGAFFTQENSGGKTASKVRFDHFEASTLVDPTLLSFAAFGDLA